MPTMGRTHYSGLDAWCPCLVCGLQLTMAKLIRTLVKAKRSDLQGESTPRGSVMMHSW
jgi:hypothetical protein